MPSSDGHHLVISMTALLTSFAPVTTINGDLSYAISFLTIADVGTQLQKIGERFNRCTFQTRVAISNR